MKEKQIEEMAFNLIMATSPLGVKDLTKQFDYNTVAKDLYELYGWRKQEWISVEDRLPEDVYGKDRKQIVVLVLTKSGRISSASRMRMSKWDKTKLEWVELDTFRWSRGLRVTHWMPLPDAPKGGK